KSWDSRIAAGQAIEAIAEHVKDWRETLAATIAPAASEPIDPLQELLEFDSLDIEAVLQKGLPLLASGGTEFDLVGSATKNAEKETDGAAGTRSKIYGRLCPGGLILVDFFDETDVKAEAMAKTANQEKRDALSLMEDSVKVKKEWVLQTNARPASATSSAKEPQKDPFEGLSARERQQLKRKLKQAMKQGKSMDT
ncbi:btaf1 RNA polymerase II, B-TFIID transcription factor-associated, 170kDa, partial [Kappamyces sp. JEL0680]